MIKSSLISPDIAEQINGLTIILDTNAFVEGYSSPEQFSILLDELTGAGCSLTTIEAIRIEFLSRNRSLEELQKKVNFYISALTYSELPTRTYEAQFRDNSLLFAFGVQQDGSFKAVDFMITAAMKRYASKVILLTNDHNDFTCKLFNLIALLPLIPSKGAMIPFGLYSFAEDKYAELIKQR